MKSHALRAAVLGLLLVAPPALAQTDESGETSAGGEAGEQESAAPADYGLETPLAEVNGTALTLGELIAIRRDLPDQYQALPNKVLLDGIVEQMIDQYLLAEAAREAGIDERPAVEISLRNQRRAILADAYLQAELGKRVTDERVRALYEERYVEAEPEDEVHAYHILVETEEEADEIKAKLDEGADFSELAKEHGTDGTAQRGGDLGWFVQSDMVPEFAEKAFAMEPGTISEPVQTDFGWHIIKLEDRRPRTPPEFEEVRQELMQEVVRNAQVAVVEELRAEADIEKPEAPVPPEAIRAEDLLEVGQPAE